MRRNAPHPYRLDLPSVQVHVLRCCKLVDWLALTCSVWICSRNRSCLLPNRPRADPRPLPPMVTSPWPVVNKPLAHILSCLCEACACECACVFPPVRPSPSVDWFLASYRPPALGPSVSQPWLHLRVAVIGLLSPFCVLLLSPLPRYFSPVLLFYEDGRLLCMIRSLVSYAWSPHWHGAP